MVAGSAALVKQRNPGWQPWQIKSALLNTATQDVTDSNQTASAIAVGAGKLNSGNAVAANVTLNPQTASFGVIQALPVTQTFQVQNNGANPVSLQLSVNSRITDPTAAISLSPSSLTIAPGESAQFTASLNGTASVVGSYDGGIILQGDVVTLRIPYLYIESDGVPNNINPLLGGEARLGWRVRKCRMACWLSK